MVEFQNLIATQKAKQERINRRKKRVLKRNIRIQLMIDKNLYDKIYEKWFEPVELTSRYGEKIITNRHGLDEWKNESQAVCGMLEEYFKNDGKIEDLTQQVRDFQTWYNSADQALEAKEKEIKELKHDILRLKLKTGEE